MSDELHDHARQIAESFHTSYERLAPKFGYKTRKPTRGPWDDLPGSNRVLMIATVLDLIESGVIVPGVHVAGLGEREENVAKAKRERQARERERVEPVDPAMVMERATAVWDMGN